MRISRRDFIKSASAAGVGMLIPGTGTAAGHFAARAADWNKVLVLVEFDGGNDGLNTVIPYNVSHYVDRRGGTGGGLRYLSGDITNAGTYLGTAAYNTQDGAGATQAGTQPFGLNPGMTELMAAWNANDLAIIHGVGYDEPNLSHFRGIDIMNTGSDSDELLYEGWLGRVLAANSPPGSLTTQGVITGRYSSNPLNKAGLRYLAMSRPVDFIERSLGLRDTDPTPISVPEFKHLLAIQHDVYNAAGQFRRAFVTPLAPNTYATINSKDDYAFTPPTFTNAASFNLKSAFEEQCLYVAQMIVTAANADASKRLQIPVFKLSIGGFDNHSNQKAHHQDLLAQVASGLAGLRSAIKQYGDALWDRVLIMTYSEFGRRAEQNGSGGTDHGSATCHFMLGGAVNGHQFYGRQPGLKPRPAWNSPANVYDLDTRGNLKATVDYRHLYNKAVTWMGLTPDAHIATPPAITGGAGADPLAGILP
jgi:uncharacterized protein (DUF1501 family)